MPEDNVKRNIRPILIAIIVALSLCIAGLLIYWMLFSGEAVAKREIREKLELAERYLDELDYDRAIACYKEVVKIDPANTEVLEEILDAYLEWAKEEEDPAEADRILAEAEEYFTELAETAEDEELSEEAERIAKKIRRKREELSAAAAEAEESDEDDTPDEGRREAELVSPEDLPDYEELHSLLCVFSLFGSVPYDHEKPGESFINNILWEGAYQYSCYPMNVTIIWDGSETDPKGSFQQFAYISMADLQWALRNVYNCSEEDIRQMKMENQYRYEYEGVLYFHIGGVGGPQALYIDEVSYDGVDYTVNYHIGLYDEMYYEDTDIEYRYLQAVVRHKMYGNTGYWSLYSNKTVEPGAADGSEGSGEEYKEAYDRFLKEISASCPHDLVYTEIYLDDDDIPELVLADYQNPMAGSNGYIFTYRNNEVTFLESIGYTNYGCFDYYEYGGVAFASYTHTSIDGKVYLHVGADSVSYHIYRAETYDMQGNVSYTYEELTELFGDWELDASEYGFNAYQRHTTSNTSTAISRADFEGSDTKELKSVKGKKLRSLTEDDYRYVSER